MKLETKIMAVLIVDDSQVSRRIIRSIVEPIAKSIIECASGEEGVRQCRLHQPHWVFMDIEMGGMNGIEATRIIKQELPGINIAIVSMYDDPDLRKEASEAGACAYVVKSRLFELESLLSSYQIQPAAETQTL